MKTLPLLLALLAAGGFLLAAYFTLASCRLFDAASPRLPRFLRMERGACGAVLFSRFGRVLGVPNSVPGMAYYLLVADVALAGTAGVESRLLLPAVVAAAGSLALGGYLLHALIYRLKAP